MGHDRSWRPHRSSDLRRQRAPQRSIAIIAGSDSEHAAHVAGEEDTFERLHRDTGKPAPGQREPPDFCAFVLSGRRCSVPALLPRRSPVAHGF